VEECRGDAPGRKDIRIVKRNFSSEQGSVVGGRTRTEDTRPLTTSK
jgi:hypothetical protein